MSYKLQIQRKNEKWETLYEDEKPVNVVVQYLAYLTEEPGYPLHRVQENGTTHLWTEVDGTLNSSRYLDRLVDQIMDVVAKSKQQ